MNSLYPFIYTAFFIASAITLIVGMFTKSTTSLGAFIAGYSVLGLATMMVLIVFFANVLQTSYGHSTLQTLVSLFSTSGAFLLLLGVLGFLLYQSIHYKHNIATGRVAPRYQAFNIVTVILLLIQVFLIVRSDPTNRHSNVTTSLLYLVGSLTAISAINQYMILAYYSTDGFHLRLP